MANKILRQIVHIDEEKCNGCGVCVPSCAEGALQIIEGKVKLVNERYCDGLGACLGECPTGAISIEERTADDFDEEAVSEYLKQVVGAEPEALACGCPSCDVVTAFSGTDTAAPGPAAPSRLGHWPVQLTLVPPGAPFLVGADIVVAADCVPFSYAGFHEEILRGHALLIACPKLDDFDAHLAKLTQVLKAAQPKSLTVVMMEVPCCAGLLHMVRQAVEAAGIRVPIEEIIISIQGEIKSRQAV
ncbi:ATP-binding protein [Chloroflexota bacterium]